MRIQLSLSSSALRLSSRQRASSRSRSSRFTRTQQPGAFPRQPESRQLSRGQARRRYGRKRPFECDHSLPVFPRVPVHSGLESRNYLDFLGVRSGFETVFARPRARSRLLAVRVGGSDPSRRARQLASCHRAARSGACPHARSRLQSARVGGSNPSRRASELLRRFVVGDPQVWSLSVS